MPDVSVLEVMLHGEPVGTLSRFAGDRLLFAFNDAYLDDPDRPVLGLGFKDAFGELIAAFRPTQRRLMPFFSNLLPEGPMRTYLADRAGVNPEREFFLLWALGRDLPGAVAVRPTAGEAWPTDDDEGGRSDDLRRNNALRFSLAGVQLKFSAIAEARGGLTLPAEGVGGSWIVKLPSRQFGSVPENEFSMLTLAQAVGIQVPAIRLVDVDAIANLPDDLQDLTGRALAIERFDRRGGPGGEPVHTEDFAQVFGVYPEGKYKKAAMRSIARVLAAEAPLEDSAELVRRIVFNALIGNADMHLKNWSLIYPDRRQARLAPAYDFVSTVAYIADDTVALKVSRSKRFDEFGLDELAHFAAKAMLPETLVLDTARETVSRFHDRWRTEMGSLPLSAATIDAIEAHLKRVPIARSG